MYPKNIQVFTVYTCLKITCLVVGSLITDVTIMINEHWNKNEECCTPFPPEDFMNCVTHKRRSLPASSHGFKSISCQCHGSPVTTEVQTRTRWVQTFRQCLLTDEEHRESSPVKNKKIFRACLDGNLPAVKYIILKHPEKIWTKRKNNKQTPAMFAAVRGRTEVFNFLACRTCTWHETDKKNNNILHLACMGGSIDIVKRVLRFADINSKGEYGRNAILIAIRKGHVGIAEILIKAGCNSHAVDVFENNLLHMACKSRSMRALSYVTEKGILNMESRDADGMTPLLTSVEVGFFEGSKYLIAQGAALDTVDKDGDTMLHQVFEIERTNKIRIDMMQYFLFKRLVNKESKGWQKHTPLLRAAQKGDLDLFKLLVVDGCNTKAVDEYGDTILHLAAYGGHYALVEYILGEAFISIFERDSKGRTVLMKATHGSIDVFKLLQRHGCKLTTLDNRGNTVLHQACAHGHVKMIKYILTEKILYNETKGAYGYTPLMYTVRYGHVSAFKLMLDVRCSTEKKDNKGNTILHVACKYGKKEIVKLLIKLNIFQCYTQEKNDKGQTPRELAVHQGFDEIVHLLKDL